MLDMQNLFNIYCGVFLGIIGSAIIGWDIGRNGWNVGRKGLILLGLDIRGPFVVLSLWAIAVAWGVVTKIEGQPVQFPTSPHPIWFLLWGVFIFFLGRLSLPKSLFLFNNAKGLHDDWNRLYYTPGKTGDPQKIEALRNSPKVQEAENLCKEAIKLEEQGTYRYNLLRNRINAAIGYQQLGFLYRIQERWDEAIDTLHKSLNLSKELNSEYPEEKEILMTLSMGIFRLGEIDHAQGRYKEAKKRYKDSLEVGQKFVDEESIRTTDILMEQIEKEE